MPAQPPTARPAPRAPLFPLLPPPPPSPPSPYLRFPHPCPHLLSSPYCQEGPRCTPSGCQLPRKAQANLCLGMMGKPPCIYWCLNHKTLIESDPLRPCARTVHTHTHTHHTHTLTHPRKRAHVCVIIEYRYGIYIYIYMVCIYIYSYT